MRFTLRVVAMAAICTVALIPLNVRADEDNMCMVWSANWTGFYEDPEDLCTDHLPQEFKNVLDAGSGVEVIFSLKSQSRKATFNRKTMNGTCVHRYEGDINAHVCEKFAEISETALGKLSQPAAPFHAKLMNSKGGILMDQIRLTMIGHKKIHDAVRFRVSQIQPALPMDLNNGVELSKVTAGPGLIMNYNYRHLIPTVESYNDTMIRTMRNLAVSTVCQEPGVKDFLLNGVEYLYSYARKNGDHLAQIRIKQEDCPG